MGEAPQDTGERYRKAALRRGPQIPSENRARCPIPRSPMHHAPPAPCLSGQRTGRAGVRKGKATAYIGTETGLRVSVAPTQSQFEGWG